MSCIGAARTAGSADPRGGGSAELRRRLGSRTWTPPPSIAANLAMSSGLPQFPLGRFELAPARPLVKQLAC